MRNIFLLFSAEKHILQFYAWTDLSRRVFFGPSNNRMISCDFEFESDPIEQKISQPESPTNGKHFTFQSDNEEEFPTQLKPFHIYINGSMPKFTSNKFFQAIKRQERCQRIKLNLNNVGNTISLST
ncbi:hypothetical protein CDL12_20181 [Handroanthus impetiginosus]|uniref:Uncharacterized protein n=1 Tax=Handroanthus impetiginosus TaxID=429701 RepID=A0A2G9GPN1_9LAMI|nr:hypothetical protein CDL12_20181 [Handroanthus impetiginosus]